MKNNVIRSNMYAMLYVHFIQTECKMILTIVNYDN